MHTLTDARYQTIHDEFSAGIEPTAAAVEAAMDRFWGQLIQAEATTGRWPHVLRFPRPANDVEAAVQLFAFRYTIAQVRRPVLLEYINDDSHTDPTVRPRRVPTRHERRAGVSLRHAWRVVRRILTLTAPANI